MTMRTALFLSLLLPIMGGAGGAYALENPDYKLDSTDWEALDDTAQHSLEYARTDESVPWVNPDSETEGTFTPVATHEGPEGQVCREYAVDAIIDGREEVVYGTACRLPDGSWVEANAEYSESEPTAATSEVYSGTDWQWIIPNIAISGVYCSSSFCVGGRYGSYYPSWYYPWGISFSYWDYGNRGYYYPYYRHHHNRYRTAKHHRDRYRHHGRTASHHRTGHRNDYRDGHESTNRDGHSERANSRNRSPDRDRPTDTRSRTRHSKGERYASTRSESRGSGDERNTSNQSRSYRSKDKRYANVRPETRRSGDERNTSNQSISHRSKDKRYASVRPESRRSGGERKASRQSKSSRDRGKHQASNRSESHRSGSERHASNRSGGGRSDARHSSGSRSGRGRSGGKNAGRSSNRH
jgi:surface antigen